MAGFINKENELSRLTKEIEKLQNEVTRIENKLSNQSFVDKHQSKLLLKEREKMQGYLEGVEKLKQQYNAIESL